MKKTTAFCLLFASFLTPLLSVVIRTNNDLVIPGEGLGGTLKGTVEVITEPSPTFDDQTGKPNQDRFGNVLYDNWDVRMTIQDEKALEFPGEDTIWLHAKLPHTSNVQFTGWEGIDDKLTNPVQITLSMVDSVTAVFESKPETYTHLLSSTPSSVWIESSNKLGVVELITEPAVVEDKETGKPLKDDQGFPVLGWDTLMSIQSRKKIDLPNEQTIWLHASPMEEYQFAGWEGINDKFTNPVEILLSEVNSITALFEAIPGTENPTLADPFSSIIIKSNNDLGVVEIISEPTPLIDLTTGREVLDNDGSVVNGWSVVTGIQSQREIDLPNEHSIWLHAAPKVDNQFTGWEGINDQFTNPIQITLSEVDSITATFQKTSEIEKIGPIVSGWFWSQDMNGWFYTTKALYPFIWSNKDQAWWRYEKTVNNQRHYTKFGNTHSLVTVIFE